MALLTTRELKQLRNNLVAKGGKPASVNRDMRGLKAALNLAAKNDRARIVNAQAWKDGLEMLPDAYNVRVARLTDDEIRSLILAAYAEDAALGLLVEVGAATGARPSQLARLEVGDLELARADGPRVQMPSSRKGKGVKRITRYPLPIPPGVAEKLKRAAGTRAASAPLLLKTDGTAWISDNSEHRRGFQCAVQAVGLDPKAVTFYWLRHSSIIRALLAGTPIRLVAVAHDTSVGMIERTYSKYIVGHGDAQLRRTQFDITSPAADNVRTLSGRRS